MHSNLTMATLCITEKLFAIFYLLEVDCNNLCNGVLATPKGGVKHVVLVQ